MHTSKIPVFVAALIGLIGCFLPWANTLKFEELSSISGLCFAEGGIALTLFLLLAIISFFKTGTRELTLDYNKTVALLSSLIVGMTLFKILGIQAQAARTSSFGINVTGITQYEATTGLFISMLAAASITLYMVVQLILRFRKVTIPEKWQSPLPTGRFYLPAHHNTTL